MLSWHWPYVFLLLPLPLLLRWFSKPQASASGAIRVPFYESLQTLNQNQTATNSLNWLRALLLCLIWFALVGAVARPTWVGEPIQLPQEKRDMMLAVDISRSMLEDDMLIGGNQVSRLEAVKAVVGDFVEERVGDRLGLILFGQQGYLQTPLTFDNKTVKQQLQEALAGFAGNATAIGDAIGLAIKILRDRPAESRVLILLTDGANTAGTEPSKAADIAAEAGIRIHTIGVGADSKLVRGVFGRTRQVNPSADLDEATLTEIAQKTGGLYFRARNPDELHAIYQELDRLEPIPEEQTFRPTRSLSYIGIVIALILSLGLFGLLNQRLLRGQN